MPIFDYTFPSHLKVTLRYFYKQIEKGKHDGLPSCLMMKSATNVVISPAIITKYNIHSFIVMGGLFGQEYCTASAFLDENYVVIMHERSRNGKTYLSNLSERISDGTINLANHQNGKIIELKSDM